MISQETIDEILQVATIEKVVGDRIKLKKDGANMVGICPFHSEKTGSLKVNSQKKMFKCFGCSKSGNAIGFVMEFNKVSFVEAVKTLAKEFNVMVDESELNGVKKEYSKPAEIKLPLDEKTEKWFYSRGITKNTLMRFGICNKQEWMPGAEGEVNCVCFKYYENEELVNVKYRDAQKRFKLEKGAKLIFYNIDAVKKHSEAIITEGEIDALSAYEAGFFNVVSVPNGASKGTQRLEYLDNNIEDFVNKEKVYIATDNDHAGLLLKEELVRRIGEEKCWIVRYPEGCKDLNDVLKTHGTQGVKDCFDNASQPPVEGIFEVKDVLSELNDLFYTGYPVPPGVGYKEFDEHIKFAPCRLTVITGIPSHGKTDFVDQILVRQASRNGWKVGYFSPERQPPALHIAMLEQLYMGIPFFSYKGGPKMSPAQHQIALEFVQEHFVFYNVNDVDSTIDGILEKARQLVVRYGINALVIDPYNYIEAKKDKDEKDTDYAGRVLTKMAVFAKTNKCHVFLIAHPRKMPKIGGKYEIPTPYDISSSANFSNKADNNITVHRDFENNDVYVYVQKRKFKWEGDVGFSKFKYDLPTGRYAECVKENDIFADRHNGFEAEYQRNTVQETLSFEEQYGYPEEWK